MKTTFTVEHATACSTVKVIFIVVLWFVYGAGGDGCYIYIHIHTPSVGDMTSGGDVGIPVEPAVGDVSYGGVEAWGGRRRPPNNTI